MDKYDPVVFNSLPTVHIAATKVGNLGGDQLIRTKVKSLLLEHSLNQTIGVALVHRHFDLKPDEIMVEYRGVATPWNTAELERYQSFGVVLPLSWVIVDGEPRAYEFYFTTDIQQSPPDMPSEFLAQYDALLRDNDLEDVLGIRGFRGGDQEPTTSMMEFTQRYATFTVPWTNKSDYVPNGSVYRTCWSFKTGREDPADLCIHCCNSPIGCAHFP